MVPAPLGRCNASVGQPLFKIPEILCLLSRPRDVLLQILGPNVGSGTPLVEALGMVGNSVPGRRSFSDLQSVIAVDLVLDLKRPREVGWPLLILPPGLGVDSVPDDVDVRMLTVTVYKRCVVMARCHLPGQLPADFKQLVVGDLSGLAVVWGDVKAGVVILAAALVSVDLPCQIPGRRKLSRLDPEAVLRRHALLRPPSPTFGLAEVGDHLGGRAAG